MRERTNHAILPSNRRRRLQLAVSDTVERSRVNPDAIRGSGTRRCPTTSCRTCYLPGAAVLPTSGHRTPATKKTSHDDMPTSQEVNSVEEHTGMEPDKLATPKKAMTGATCTSSFSISACATCSFRIQQLLRARRNT
jgi:hypothetical protein